MSQSFVKINFTIKHHIKDLSQVVSFAMWYGVRQRIRFQFKWVLQLYGSMYWCRSVCRRWIYGDGWDIIKLYTIEFNTSCIPTKFSLLLLESASTSHAASAFVTHTIFSHDSSHPTSVYSIHYIQPSTPEFIQISIFTILNILCSSTIQESRFDICLEVEELKLRNGKAIQESSLFYFPCHALIITNVDNLSW